jgi:hypothetical protein
MYTLTLNPASWDIFIDKAGNIATSAGAYAIAQNVASACRLFTNDAYFAKEKGLPHFDIELGAKAGVSEAVLRTRLKRAALSVEGVVDAAVTLKLDEGNNRVLGGDIALTLVGGRSARVEL